MRTHHHSVLEHRDPNDMPFVAVLREAGGDALLTADRDLLDSLEAAITAADLMSLLRDYARQKAIAVGVSGQVYAGAFAFGHGGSFLVRGTHAVASALKALPTLAKLALAVGAVWIATRPASRAWLSKQLNRAVRAFDRALPRIADAVAEGGKAEMNAAAIQSKVRGRLRRPKRVGLRAALLRVARDEVFGMTVAEFARRLVAIGYKTTARRFTEFLERYLDRDPMFARTATGWRLVSK
jgi:hypothetical protein